MEKTRRLYNFVSDQFGIENIEKRRLKISFPDQVNDLFELRPFDFGEQQVGRRLRQAWGRSIKESSMSQGFISFTEGWEVPTMWAHYADNHRGVCLGFDLPMLRADGTAFADQIDYVPKLKPMDERVLQDAEYNKKMIDFAKKTKSQHWAYEKEWRYWFSLSEKEKQTKRSKQDELFFAEFDERLILKEVIFGHRSRLSPQKIKNLLLPSDNVEFTTARPSFREFAMVPQRLGKLQKK